VLLISLILTKCIFVSVLQFKLHCVSIINITVIILLAAAVVVVPDFIFAARRGIMRTVASEVETRTLFVQGLPEMLLDTCSLSLSHTHTHTLPLSLSLP